MLFRRLKRVLGTVSHQSAIGWELYPPCKHFFALPWDNMRVGKSESLARVQSPGDWLAGKYMAGFSLTQFIWIKGITDGVWCMFHLAKYLNSLARAVK